MRTIDEVSEPQGVPRVFFTRHETALALGHQSVATVDRLIKSGALRAARIGARVVVSAEAIEEFRREVEGVMKTEVRHTVQRDPVTP